MCDQFGDCSNDGTCQLVLRNRVTGMELVEHHCKAHLVLRIWELERDDEFDVVDARPLDRSLDVVDVPETDGVQPAASDSPIESPDVDE